MKSILGAAAVLLFSATSCNSIGMWDDGADAGINAGDDPLKENDAGDTSAAPKPTAVAPPPDRPKPKPEPEPEPKPTPAEDAGTDNPQPPPPDPEEDAGTDTEEPPGLSATVVVDTATRHQTLVGFGASAAWYGDRLTNHPHKDVIYDKVFADLGLDVLRLRNVYRREGGMFDPDSAEIVAEGERSLGRAPTVLLTSWSPPADLKANSATDCASEAETCTLQKIDGEYPYVQFADWWRESLDAYAAIGIIPDYISIQNEPDFTPPSWEGCRFDPVEGTYPGYNQALGAVRAALDDMAVKPRFIGPESVGIRYDKIRNYDTAMFDTTVDALAHHLYDGDWWQHPDLFVPLMRDIAQSLDGRPLFQTEFSDTASHDALQTAWLIHNALVEGNASAYLYWELFWVDGQGLVTLESHHAQNTWTTEHGYIVQPEYYSMQHYAKYTDPGYVRVTAAASEKVIRASAFQAPDDSRTTVVLLNTGDTRAHVRVDGLGAPTAIYRTGGDDTFSPATLDEDSSLTLAARGLATLVFE